jgi:large subunit ribosomal protein L6e
MAKKPRVAPRNKVIAGISLLSRSKKFHLSGKWAVKNKKKFPKKVEEKKPTVQTIGGAKNGNQRTVLPKESRVYSTEDVHVRLPRRNVIKPTKLKANVTPGTVLILLAGRFRGKRVVFLKQLKSGLLLVTGPYKLNGVPLRRVNQSLVIATSTKLDLATLNIDLNKFNDDYFKKPEQEKKKKSEAEFFAAEDKNKKPKVATQRVSDQKEVDAKLLTQVKNTPLLRQYLGARFTLTHNLHPHDIKF